MTICGRPPTGPLGKQVAKVRDDVDRALLERQVESLQKPARRRAVTAAT